MIHARRWRHILGLLDFGEELLAGACFDAGWNVAGRVRATDHTCGLWRAARRAASFHLALCIPTFLTVTCHAIPLPRLQHQAPRALPAPSLPAFYAFLCS